MLRPDDIVNYQLKQTVRGYSMPQVDELLDQVADELERVQSELELTRARLEQSESRLAATSETESTLKRTLVTAQQAAERSIEEAKQRASEMLDAARREAAGLTEAARLDAEEIKVDALQNARAEEAEIRRRRQDLEQRVEALRVFERDYRGRLRSFLEEQLRSIDDLQAPPSVHDDVEDEVADSPLARDSEDDGASVRGGTPPPPPASPGTGATDAGPPPLQVRVHETE